MKKLVFMLVCVVLAYGSESPLSEQKNELLKLKREKITKDAEIGEKKWISPLTIFTSINKSRDITNSDIQTKSAGVDWSQDIFRSGGILYSIEKAKALGKANMLGVDIEEASYLKKIYTLLSQIKRDTLKYKQSEFTLKNRDIDLLIIKEKYKVEIADISELNRATIDRETSRTNLIAVKNILSNEIHELKKLIGDENFETISLPNIELISKSDYLKQHLELLKYSAQDESDNAMWKITQSSYLPKLTLSASYGYSDSSSSLRDYNGDNYRYGAMLSMPLDINAKAEVESNRLQLLQTRVSQLDRRHELEEEYEMRFATIADYEEKIGVADEMLKLYNELYGFTQSQVQVGLKSSYELESLKNSLDIQQLEKEMQIYNILIEKISLYFDTKREEK